MKVAYIFSSQGHTVSYKLGKMILPQLEEDRHGVEVVGMFFFEDNNYPGNFTVGIEIGLCLVHNVRATKHLQAPRNKGL